MHIDIIKDWKVTQFVSQSDHNLISFNLAMSHKIVSSYRILKKAAWVRFYSYLEDRSNQLDAILLLSDMDTRQVTRASHLNTLHTDAFKDACPVIFVKRITANPWWNSDLRHQERNVNTLKRLAYTKKSSKAAKRRYNRSLRAANCIVYSLFRDSLVQSRVPHPWLISRASLIPKTPIPSSSAAFRIINLSCVLLKILEKCIQFHLQEIQIFNSVSSLVSALMQHFMRYSQSYKMLLNRRSTQNSAARIIN